APAGIPAHAQVLLSWDPVGACPQPQGGLAIPTGATLDYRTGYLRIRGARRLSSLTAQVKDWTSSAYRDAHRWILHYDGTPEQCGRTVSPRRRLSYIEEFGTVSKFDGSLTTTQGPTVRFTYGADPDPITPSQPAPVTRSQALPGFQTNFYSSGH